MRRGRYKEESKKERQCKWCRKWFDAGRKHAQTCSPKCRKALSRNGGFGPHPPPRDPSPSPGNARRKDNRSGDSQKHPWDAILNRRTADSGLAMEILQLKLPVTKATAQTAWRRLVLENHPDRGGSTQMLQWVQAAWEYLKDFHGWK